MTRLEYWITADTQYRIHSPFVFEMYRKVLFAEVDKSLRDRMAVGVPEEAVAAMQTARRRERAYHEIVYKLRDHYGLKVVCYDSDEAVLCPESGQANNPETRQPFIEGEMKVVCRPHRCRARELRWQAQQGNTKYNVSIDLYDVGVLMYCPRMRKQRFLLK